MRATRIFQSGPFKREQMVVLSPEAGMHVGVVLRMQPGEWITLWDGNNHEYEAQIVDVNKKKVQVKIQSIEFINRESPRSIQLAQAISKGERMEWVIQKSVELGVTRIVPLITDRCVVRLDPDRMLKKMQQWHAIAIGACEQCGRNQIPQIDSPIKFDSYLQKCQANFKFILNPKSTLRFRELCLGEGDIALMIGPEGGFSEDEIQFAHQYHFQSLSLGPRVLRTETAAIASLSILQALNGDL